MSRENVELVKTLQPSEVDLVASAADAERGEGFFAADAGSEAFAEDFEVEFVAAGSGRRPHYRGGSGALEGWRDWLSPWASYRVESQEFIDAGDDVVALVHVRARTSRDDVEVEHSPAAVWTVKEGKIVRVRFFLEREEALKAAGLPVESLEH
jgi:ketosteroid isomerase-like protein